MILSSNLLGFEGSKYEKEGCKMARIIDVASYIFDEYKSISGEYIDEMKLHKLLYLSQREKLAINGETMFEESLEGWRHGPVSPLVRSVFSKTKVNNYDRKKLSDEDAYIAKCIVLQYGGFESWKLSELTHKEISWNNARKGLLPYDNGNVPLLIEDIIADSKKIRPYDPLYDMYIDEFEDLAVI